MTREEDEALAEFLQNAIRKFKWPAGRYAELDNMGRVPARTLVVKLRKFQEGCRGC